MRSPMNPRRSAQIVRGCKNLSRILHRLLPIPRQGEEPRAKEDRVLLNLKRKMLLLNFHLFFSKAGPYMVRGIFQVTFRECYPP